MKRIQVNCNKPQLWKSDIEISVDHYNRWFLEFAPKAYRDARGKAIERVLYTLKLTQNLSIISVDTLQQHPDILSILRMTTAPPLARDRLIGLTGVSANLVHKMESGVLPPRMKMVACEAEIEKIVKMIELLRDVDIFPWLDEDTKPTENERYRAASIIADRVCGADANPIIRNEQEKRQLAAIQCFLEARGYRAIPSGEIANFRHMPKGTFLFRYNVPVTIGDQRSINIPLDVMIMRKKAATGELPLMIECKSAGDFTNTNKRRKEEAAKMTQLRNTYGKDVRFFLFLCGYFDSSYLGYEAAEGIDWIWEHRMEDMNLLGI